MKRAKSLVAMLLLGFAGNALGDCTVNVTPINFGVYYPTSGATSSADIAITCNIATNYNIKLDTGFSGTYNDRAMRSTTGPYTLTYNLYTDPGYSFIWGDGTGGTQTFSDFNAGIVLNYKIYGAIPADELVPDGVYTDAVTVLVEW